MVTPQVGVFAKYLGFLGPKKYFHIGEARTPNLPPIFGMASEGASPHEGAYGGIDVMVSNSISR